MATSMSDWSTSVTLVAPSRYWLMCLEVVLLNFSVVRQYHSPEVNPATQVLYEKKYSSRSTTILVLLAPRLMSLMGLP